MINGGHPLRVLLISGVPDHTSDFEEVLENAGHTVIVREPLADRLIAWFDHEQPDIIVLDVDCPTGAMFASLAFINEEKPCPVAMFSGNDDRALIEKAVESGVSAYVVRGYYPKRIIPVIETAMLRFNKTQALRSELDKTKRQLEERKLIERAKGIVMKKSSLDEEAAYKTLRDMAMRQNMKLSEIARSVITAAELLV